MERAENGTVFHLQLADGVFEPSKEDAIALSLHSLRDVFSSGDEEVRFPAVDLHREQLGVGFIRGTDVLAMLDTVLEQADPRRDGLAFDFLIPASGNRNARARDNHNSPLSNVFLELGE